ncbi:MAG: VWA domain-containing protein [Anaerolineae bacterium]
MSKKVFSQLLAAVLSILLAVFLIQPLSPLMAGTRWYAADLYPDHAITGSWSTKAPMSVPRDRAAAVALDGKIYVMGGTNSSGALASMEVYDSATNTWTTKASMPGAKSEPGAAVANGRIYVVGPPDNRLYEYNPATNTWAIKAPLPATPAGAVAVASISGKIFVTFNVSGETRWRLYAYDPFQDTWERRSDHPDALRSIASLGVSNGMIYAVGGGIIGQTPQETTRIDRYDPSSDQWTVNAIPPMATRRTHLGATLPTIYGRMFVFGGWDGYTALANAEVYDPWTNAWSALPPMPTARYKAAYAAVGYKIYVIGGNWGGAGGHWLTTNEEFSLPEPAEPENPIAFVSDRDGYYEIYTMNSDGSHQLRITNNECADWHPSWTPDGKRILFSTDCRGNRDIYSMNPDGSDWRRLTTAPESDHRPFMSPNGQTIAFVRGSSPNEHIWLMNSDGTNPRQLTTGPGTEDDTAIAWSPDSRQIVFRSTRSGNWQLWRINVDGTGLTQLTNLPEEAHDPAWSPDGSTIAFASQGEIMLMNPDGSNIRTLPGPGWEFRPAWSPDGSRLVYGSYWRGDDIFSKKTDNTDERNLTNSPDSTEWDPAWARWVGGCVPGTTPVDVMLVIDRSGSMSGQPLADAKVAAKGFVDRMNMAQDQIGLVSFADSATLNQQLTHSANAVKSAIDALSAGGSTNMTAGINAAQAELTSSRHNLAARPVILFMSDGQPTVDTPASAVAAAQAAKNAGTRIFTIGLGSVDDNLMRQIASSPSDYYYAPTSADLAAIYQTIAGQVTCTQAKVKVSPASKRVPLSGGTFTMDIVAQDVTNLAAYQVELTYNPAIVHVTAVTPGPFLGSTGRTVSPVGPVIDNAAGIVRFGAFTFGAQPGVNGTGVLATITFQPRARGTSNLHLQNLQLADPNGNPLSATTEDGQVEVVSCFGDFDGDGDVDIVDLQRAASHWNCRSGDACYDVQFDTEPDGDIDVFDLQRFAAAWGTTCPTTYGSAQGRITSQITEQTAVGLQMLPATVLVSPGDLFTLTVRIENASDIGAFQTDVVYDPAIVQVEGVTAGPFLSSTGRTVSPLGPDIDNIAGRVVFGAYTFGSQPGASGSGELAYIRLRGQGIGRSVLDFQHTGISDVQGNPLYLGNLEGSTVTVSSQLFKTWLPLLLKNR